MRKKTTFTEKTQKMNRTHKLFTLILVLCLTSGLIGYAVAQTPTQTTYIQPGSQTSTFDYISWKDGSNYFLKNGETGRVTSDTVATDLINPIIADDVSVYLKGDSYTITTAIIIYQKTNVHFEIDDLTVSGDICAFNITEGRGNRITGGFIYRSQVPATVPVILIHNSLENQINLNKLYGAIGETHTGIEISSNGGQGSYWNQINVVYIVGFKTCVHIRTYDSSGAVCNLNNIHVPEMFKSGGFCGVNQTEEGGLGDISDNWVHDSCFQSSGDANDVGFYFSGIRTKIYQCSAYDLGSGIGIQNVIGAMFVVGGTFDSNKIINNDTMITENVWYVNGYGEVSGSVTVTGAVNSIYFEHDLAEAWTSASIEPAGGTANNCGWHYISAGVAGANTIYFENQPGGSTWEFFYWLEYDPPTT